MTTAEVLEHPGRMVMPTYRLYGSRILTIAQECRRPQRLPRDLAVCGDVG